MEECLLKILFEIKNQFWKELIFLCELYLFLKLLIWIKNNLIHRIKKSKKYSLNIMVMERKLNRMVNSIIVCFYLFNSCTEGYKESNNRNKEKGIISNNIFIPDVSINGKLLLNSPKSLLDFYEESGRLELINFVRESPIMAFSNSSKSEYLFAYQYEGNIENEFSCFEIGYYDENINFYTQMNYKGFQTESGLKLGLTLTEVEKIKGKNYIKNGDKIIYQIVNPKSEFLKHYNMPEYFLECYFKQDKLIKIRLGFGY